MARLSWNSDDTNCENIAVPRTKYQKKARVLDLHTFQWILESLTAFLNRSSVTLLHVVRFLCGDDNSGGNGGNSHENRRPIT